AVGGIGENRGESGKNRGQECPRFWFREGAALRLARQSLPGGQAAPVPAIAAGGGRGGGVAERRVGPAAAMARLRGAGLARRAPAPTAIRGGGMPAALGGR